MAEVSRRLKDGGCEEGSVEEQWQVMKSALCEAANSTLGTSLRKKADWFEESAGVLRPMLENRRGAYLKWLATGNEKERKKFVEMRSVGRRAVRDVKNSWFLRNTRNAQVRLLTECLFADGGHYWLLVGMAWREQCRSTGVLDLSLA